MKNSLKYKILQEEKGDRMQLDDILVVFGFSLISSFTRSIWSRSRTCIQRTCIWGLMTNAHSTMQAWLYICYLWCYSWSCKRICNWINLLLYYRVYCFTYNTTTRICWRTSNIPSDKMKTQKAMNYRLILPCLLLRNESSCMNMVQVIKCTDMIIAWFMKNTTSFFSISLWVSKWNCGLD